jgi:hypothetical protein
MQPTPEQLVAGIDALKQLVGNTDGFLAEKAIPDTVYDQAVAEICAAGNEVDGGTALMKSIAAAGYGGQVTAEQCQVAAGVVLAAVVAVQEKH